MGMQLIKTPLGQVREVKHLLMNENARAQLSAVAAKHMNPERMMRVTANAIRTTPKLAQCEPMSFLGALMQCAALGLEPNTVLGHAYMIPFENRKKGVTEVQVVVGYKGLIDLARRSGHITSLSANIHFSDDEMWEYEEGTEARLRHRPGPQRGDKLAAYAIAKFKDGGHAYVVLPWAKVMEIRDSSQGYQTAKRFGKLNDTPWVKHEDEMAKKTAIRALAKYLPLSVEFMEAVEVDDTRADYAAFAFDPSAGVHVDGDDIIDGAADEAPAAVAQIEDKKPAPAATDRAPARRREAAPRQQVDYAPEERKRTTRQQEDTGALDLGDQEPARDEDEGTPIAMFESLVENMLGELDDGVHPDEIAENFEPQIEQMKTKAPALHKRITDALNAARG